MLQLTRPIKLVLALSALCLAAANGGAGDRQAGSHDYANDPRSGAAINLEIAKRKLKTYNPAVYGVYGAVPLRGIGAGTVNGPLADSTARDTQSETTIVNLGGGRLVAAWNDSGSFTGSNNHFTGYGYSSNNGLSWTDAGALPASAEGDAGDPVLANDRTTGEVYLSTLGFNTGDFIQVFKSTDFGHTFAAPVNGTPGFPGTDFQDKEWMTVDNFAGSGNGNVYLCWTRFGTGVENIMFTRSTNHGASFGPSGGTLVSTGGQGCFVTVSPNHQVSVFYYRGTGSPPFGQGGDNKLFMRRSTDRGLTFQPEVQVADLVTTSVNGNLALNGGLRSNSFPHAAVNPDPAKPFIYVVYNDDPSLANTTDNGNIFMVRSTNAGATWSAPIAVAGGARDQFFPTIGFASAGNLMVGFYNRLQDPNNVWFHRSGRLARLGSTGVPAFNGTFQLSPNTPLAIGQDPAVNSTYMGDYDQIAGGGGRLFSTWSDNRNGNAFHAHQPDVRFASIVAPAVNSDLRMTIAASPSTIRLNSTTQVTIRAAAATNTARDVFINMVVPLGMVVEETEGGSCKADGPFVGCKIGDVAAATSKSVVVTIRNTFSFGGTKQLKVTGTTSSRDTIGSNNTATANVTTSAITTVLGSYSTGNIAVAIADLSTVDISIAVPDTGVAFNVSPRFRLNHTFDSDLLIYLISPAGTIVELTTRNGGGGDNYGSGANDCSGTPTIFDDAAATSVTAGTAPFAGTFKPEGFLSDFGGQGVNGTWKLRVTDAVGLDVGTVGCVGLDITRIP